mgnify:CR=1 FL=1|jgi:ectoine hydroxylase-related dioxygenase (phytanoyl-CoA dioxygenase family)
MLKTFLNKLIQKIYKIFLVIHKIIFDFHPRHFFIDTFFAGNMWEIIMPNFIRKELKIRTSLLRHLQNKVHKSTILKISDEGFAFLDDCSNLLESAIKRSLILLNESGIASDDDKLKYNKPFLRALNIDLNNNSNHAIKEITTSDLILLPVANYFGHIPILITASIFFSPNKEFQSGRSQQYHMDGSDGRNVKIFIALDDIDEQSGPFVFLPKSISRRAYNSMRKKRIVKRRNHKVPDETIYQFCEESDAIVSTQRKGSALFIDSDVCYHYGSRPSPKSRKVLYLQYRSAYSKEREFTLPNREYLKDGFSSLSNNQKIKKLVNIHNMKKGAA